MAKIYSHTDIIYFHVYMDYILGTLFLKIKGSKFVCTVFDCFLSSFCFVVLLIFLVVVLIVVICIVVFASRSMSFLVVFFCHLPSRLPTDFDYILQFLSIVSSWYVLLFVLFHNFKLVFLWQDFVRVLRCECNDRLFTTRRQLPMTTSEKTKNEFYKLIIQITVFYYSRIGWQIGKYKMDRLGRYQNRNWARKNVLRSWDRDLSIGDVKWCIGRKLKLKKRVPGRKRSKNWR